MFLSVFNLLLWHSPHTLPFFEHGLRCQTIFFEYIQFITPSLRDLACSREWYSLNFRNTWTHTLLKTFPATTFAASSLNMMKDLINDDLKYPFSESAEQLTNRNRVETVNDFHRSSPPVRQCEGITGEISPKTSNQQHQILRLWVYDLPPQDNNKQSKIPEWFPQIIPTIPAAQRIYVLLTLRGFFNNTKKQTASKRDNPARTGSRIRCSKSRILISYWRILCRLFSTILHHQHNTFPQHFFRP